MFTPSDRKGIERCRIERRSVTSELFLEVSEHNPRNVYIMNFFSEKTHDSSTRYSVNLDSHAVKNGRVYTHFAKLGKSSHVLN